MWQEQKSGKQGEAKFVPGHLVHFDVICDLSLNRHAVTWNLFVLHDKKTLSFDNGEVIYASAF